MPTFYFDISDRQKKVRDLLGMELVDEAHAIHEATIVLEHLITIAKIDGKPGNIAISIRTEQCACLYEASVSLAGE